MMTASHREVASVVRAAVKRKQLVKELHELGTDLDGIVAASQQTIASSHSKENHETKYSFLKSIRPYLAAEKACVDFLTKRAEENMREVGDKRKELLQLENGGMASVMPTAINELTKKIATLESQLADDRGITKKLLSDAGSVFEGVKSMARAANLSAEECSAMHALVGQFRSLNIGNDWSPPPVMSSDATPSEDDGLDPILVDLLNKDPAKAVPISTSSPATKKSASNAVRKPAARKQEPPRKQQPKKQPRPAPAKSIKLSWAKAVPAKAPKQRQSLLEVMAEEAKQQKK